MNDKAKANGSANPSVPVFSVPEAHAQTPEQWRGLCVDLLAEIERLQAYILELNEQRLALGQMVDVPEDVKQLKGKSYEDILAMWGPPLSLDDILREFEQSRG